MQFKASMPWTMLCVLISVAMISCGEGNVADLSATPVGPDGPGASDENPGASPDAENPFGPGGVREPRGPFQPIERDVRADRDDLAEQERELIVNCRADSDCASDEACTQGGRCVNITGERSATAVLQADLNDLPRAVGMGNPYALPVNATLLIDDPDGDGVGLSFRDKIIFDGKGSALKVENGIIGIHFEPASQWSLARDLLIYPTNERVEHNGIGIEVRAHGVRLNNMLIRHMGTGIRAATYVDGVYANVNSQQWSEIVFRYNFKNAIEFEGVDSQGGLISGVEVLGGVGIRDASFLGNTYIGPLVEGTHTRSLSIERPASHSTVIGMYVEEGDPNPTANSLNDIHIGGVAISRLETVGDRMGQAVAKIRFGNEEGMRVRIPASADSAIGIRHPAESGEWRLRYVAPWRMWGWSLNGGPTVAHPWTGTQHPQGPGLSESQL